jgi:hypothetical protein
MSNQSATVRELDEGTRPLEEIVYSIDGNWAILVAFDLKLFPLLAEKPLTLQEISEKLGLATRAAEGLLTVCASRGLIEVDPPYYSLTHLSRTYLLEDSPDYFGFTFELWTKNPDISTFQGVKKMIMTNSPQIYGGVDEVFSSHEEQEEMAKHFTRAMHSNSVGPARVWPSVVDLSKHKLMLDIGGGSGAHAMGAVKYYSHLKSMIYELPAVASVAREFVEAEGLVDRIDIHVGDMWNDPYPEADVHFYSQIFHDWKEDKCRFLAKKSFEALPSGGKIILHEKILNDLKTGPRTIASFNITMMLWSEGRQYSSKEYSEFLSEAGFVNIKIQQTYGNWSVVVAEKP